MNETEAIRWISRYVQSYKDGVFCPAELWNLVAGSLTIQRAQQVLDRLPDQLQRLLGKAYAERPASLPPQDEGVRQEIERWCQRNVD